MGRTDFDDYLEANQLKLSAEQFPISCVLTSRIEEQFANTSGPGDDLELSLDELLAYVKKPGDVDLTPYADLLHQLEEMGDPAKPSREHAIVLRWVGDAFYNFEQRFPLEEPLASTVRRLKPLVTCMALVDKDFMQPDVHPIHQFLDAIQARAVGWQQRLGRAATNLEGQLNTAVESALCWFEDSSMDIAAVTAEFLDSADRDQHRAKRMCQRVIETESGISRASAARREAAAMINRALDYYLAPQALGEFLKGPWYDSARLLLLKYGTNSDEWHRMSETTLVLLDSMQNLDDADEERKQRVFSVIPKLPKEMRRWLLSLHHDANAVNDALATIEALHLRVLRQQAQELFSVSPITPEEAGGTLEQARLHDDLNFLEEWHWFAVETYKEGTIRAQLVYKNNQEQRMVFSNLAGVKVLDYNFIEFDELMSRKRVTALPSGAGFSLCLALSAGIDTVEKLQALYAQLTERSGAPPPPRPRPSAPKIIPKVEAPPEPTHGLSEEEERDLFALIGDPSAPEPAEEAPPAIPLGQQPREAASSPGAPPPELEEEQYIVDEEPESVGNSYFQTQAPEPPPADPTPGPAAHRQSALPMGTWLAFRDGDRPVEGQLTEYDASRDSYRFIDHHGDVLREISTEQLHALVNSGLVEAL